MVCFAVQNATKLYVLFAFRVGMSVTVASTNYGKRYFGVRLTNTTTTKLQPSHPQLKHGQFTSE